MVRRVISYLLALILLIASLTTALPQPARAIAYSGSKTYASGKYYEQLTQVELTGHQRVDIVNIALSQVGYQESSRSGYLSGEEYGDGNYTEYGHWYGIQSLWCASFVSWCAHFADVRTSVVPKHIFTPEGLQWFMNRGRAYKPSAVTSGEYTPLPGDIVYFKSPRNGNMCNHVGIVIKYVDGFLYTVEGNCSTVGIDTDGGAVAMKKYDIASSYIVYICRPGYSAPATHDLPTVLEGLISLAGTKTLASYQPCFPYGVVVEESNGFCTPDHCLDVQCRTSLHR